MTGFKRIYIDTAPIIYYLEHSALYVHKMRRFFEMCLENDMQIVTSTITIEEYLYSHMQAEYRADVWGNRKTGTHIHIPCPASVSNDVNYGGTVKAAAFLLGNEYNVSIIK